MIKLYSSFFLKWLLFLFALFVAGRLVFIGYNFSLIAGKTSLGNILLSFYYGFRLDLAAMCYLCLPVVLGAILLGWSTFFTNARKVLFKTYSNIVIILMALLFIADAELYKNWGTKISQQFFIYIRFPQEAMAASGSAPVVKILIFLLVFIAAMIFVFGKLFKPFNWEAFPMPKVYLKIIPMSILALAFVFIGARGGLGTVPINQSSAYFSSKNIDNNMALNSFWNFFDNLLSKSNGIDLKKYRVTSSEKAGEVFLAEYKKYPTDSVWLNTKKPNVVIIMLESFSSDLVNSLRGHTSYTPNLEMLSKEGLWFTDFYGSGDRTDKGLSAVLSGFPALPVTSIVTEPQKASKIKGLSSIFISHGYSSSFFYGGDANFANMKAYLLNSGINEFFDKSTFPSERMNSKWGAYDEDVFGRFIAEHKGRKDPFFDILLTLSSHEPFEVPYKMRVPIKEPLAEFKNSVLYADSCLGAFFRGC